MNICKIPVTVNANILFFYLVYLKILDLASNPQCQRCMHCEMTDSAEVSPTSTCSLPLCICQDRIHSPWSLPRPTAGWKKLKFNEIVQESIKQLSLVLPFHLCQRVTGNISLPTKIAAKRTNYRKVSKAILHNTFMANTMK